MKNKPNKQVYDGEKKSPIKKVLTVGRWILGGGIALFGLIALIGGSYGSSLFLHIAAYLMLPLPFMKSFYRKIRIKAFISVILSVTLLFTGVLMLGTELPSDGDETDATQSEIKTEQAETQEKETEDRITEAETQKKETNGGEETETMSGGEVKVWVTSSGSKYHSHAGCSNMRSPSQIPLEEAEEQGYEPCKKCY